MKKALLLILTCLPLLALAVNNDDMTCKEKEADINLRIKKAQANGDAEAIKELQKNLVRVQNNCDDSNLLRKLNNDVKEAKEDLDKAQKKLKKAEKKGDQKEIDKRKKQVKKAESDLKAAEKALADAKKKM